MLDTQYRLNIVASPTIPLAEVLETLLKTGAISTLKRGQYIALELKGKSLTIHSKAHNELDIMLTKKLQAKRKL